jgi:hypothetical protein
MKKIKIEYPAYWNLLINYIKNEAEEKDSFSWICQKVNEKYKLTPEYKDEWNTPDYESLRKIPELREWHDKLKNGELKRGEERYFGLSSITDLEAIIFGKLSTEEIEFLLLCRSEAKSLNAPLTIREAKWCLRWKFLGLNESSVYPMYKTTGVEFMFMDSFEQQQIFSFGVLDIAKHYASEELLRGEDWDRVSVYLDDFWTDLDKWSISSQIDGFRLKFPNTERFWNRWDRGYEPRIDDEIDYEFDDSHGMDYQYLVKCITSLPYYNSDVSLLLGTIGKSEHIVGDDDSQAKTRRMDILSDVAFYLDDIKSLAEDTVGTTYKDFESVIEKYLEYKKEYEDFHEQKLFVWEWLDPEDTIIYSSIDDFHRWKKFYTLPLKEFVVAIKKEKHHDLTKKEIEEHINYLKLREYEEERIDEIQEETRKQMEEWGIE